MDRTNAMKPSHRQPAGFANRPNAREQANSRVPALAAGFFLLGVAVSAFWFYRASHSRTGTGAGMSEAASSGVLSDGTLAILKRLDSPVEIRFYSLLDPASTSDSLRAFAERVGQVLSLYQQAANGQLKVTRYTSLADASQAAAADGLRPFNLDKGEACYLGLVVIRNGHKGILAQLSPDWEPALEPDLSRAIAQVLEASTPGRAAATKPRVDAATIAEVKRAFPNLEAVSVEEGTQQLREAAVNDMKAALAETDARIKSAEQRLTQAQTGGSDADKQAALKELQEAHAAQTEKLKQIAARAAAQVEAFKQLKAGSR